MNIEKMCVGCMKELEQAGVCPYCGYDPNVVSQEGHYLKPYTILNGKYLVGKVLGEGGFGITYIGYDLNLEMPVAIKEFYPNGFVTRESSVTSVISMYAGTSLEVIQKWKNNFIREARTLAKYSNLSGIVGVKDFFEENGTAYIAMEYLHGMTLKEYAKMSGGKLDVNYLLQCLKPVMASLAKVHESGLIHRDISPDNIMLLESGNMKLLDFGAARDYTSDGEKSLSVMLKPGYAPEEQYRTKGKQGPWSDVYAFAATMYKCITGVTPLESMERMRQDELKRPGELGIHISPVVENAIIKGMEIYAENRYQSMGEFMEALYAQNSYAVSPVSQIQPAPITQTGLGQMMSAVQTGQEQIMPVGQTGQGTGQTLNQTVSMANSVMPDEENLKKFDAAMLKELLIKIENLVTKKFWWAVAAVTSVLLLLICIPLFIGNRDKKESVEIPQPENINESFSQTKSESAGLEMDLNPLGAGTEITEAVRKEVEETQKAAEDAIRYGKDKLEEGDYDTALAYFEEAVSKGAVDNEEVYSLSSDAYLRKGDIFSAVEILSVGIERTGKITLETRRNYILDNTHILSMEEYQDGIRRRLEEYDSDGNIINQKYFDETGRSAGWGIYEYWDGLLAYEEHYYANGRINWNQIYENGVESYYCSYDEQGNITVDSSFSHNGSGVIDRQIFYDKTGNISWWKNYEYDQYGNRIMDTSFNADGSMSSWQEYGFDANGNMLRTAGYAANGTLNAFVEWEYDEYGNVIRESHYDSNGNYAWGTRYEYEYDVFGNPVRKIQYDGTDTKASVEWSYEYEYQFAF